MLKDLILKNRSYRRFHQAVEVPMELLREMVEAARLSGSARNMQPLKYMLFNDPATCAEIFPTLAWAGYLKDWQGPEEGERPREPRNGGKDKPSVVKRDTDECPLSDGARRIQSHAHGRPAARGDARPPEKTGHRGSQ